MGIMEIAFYIFMAIVGATVVKIGFTFDINKWLKVRRETQKVKFQNICPHVSMEKLGDRYYFDDLMISPRGTTAWQCRQCDLVSYIGTPKEKMEYWINNPVELVTQQQALKKQAKKMGII